MNAKEHPSLQLKKFAVPPSRFLDYKEFLQALYLNVKEQVADYTYLRFSEDLGFSATGVVHQMIRGRRVLTAKAGAKIIAALALKGLEKQYLLWLITYCNTHAADEKAEAFKRLVEIRAKLDPVFLNHDQLEFVSEWYHPVIKELIALPNLVQDPAQMAQLLMPPLRPLQVKASLELLVRLGFIRFDADLGRYVVHTHEFKTPRSAEGLLVARYHQASIELAKAAVSAIDKERRDISSTTIRISAPLLEKLKEQIYQFQMNILAQEEACVATDNIYQLNIQLFPVTKLPPAAKDK